MTTAYVSDNVLDSGLNYIKLHASILYICNALPTTYVQASSTYALGSKSTPSITGPTSASPSGRKVTCGAISDGSVTVTGTASHWALCYPGNSELLAAGPLSSGQGVSIGNVFTLTSFPITFPAPA